MEILHANPFFRGSFSGACPSAARLSFSRLRGPRGLHRYAVGRPRAPTGPADAGSGVEGLKPVLVA